MRASPSRWRLQVAGTEAVLLILSGENSSFQKDNEQKVRPNVISFELITKQDEHWFVISWYLPPSNKEGEAQQLITAALEGALQAPSPSFWVT